MNFSNAVLIQYQWLFSFSKCFFQIIFLYLVPMKSCHGLKLKALCKNILSEVPFNAHCIDRTFMEHRLKKGVFQKYFNVSSVQIYQPVLKSVSIFVKIFKNFHYFIDF